LRRCDGGECANQRRTCHAPDAPRSAVGFNRTRNGDQPDALQNHGHRALPAQPAVDDAEAERRRVELVEWLRRLHGEPR